MKKIFTLLAAALVTLTSFADRRDGMMTITQLGRNDVVVEVDGRRFNDREILIRDLEPGRHSVSIYTFDRQNGWKGIFGRQVRKEYLFNSAMIVKPRQHIDIVINRFGKVVVDYNGEYNDKYGKDDRWGHDRDWDRDRNRDRDDDYDKRRDHDYDDRNGNRNDNRYDNRSAMDMRSFDMLKQALRRENFENSRLAIAKQSVERNAFSAQQVKEMVNLFAFESNKLELAKSAYDNTIDKKNYFIIYDAFSFNRSKEELAEYVRRK